MCWVADSLASSGTFLRSFVFNSCDQGIVMDFLVAFVGKSCWSIVAPSPALADFQCPLQSRWKVQGPSGGWLGSGTVPAQGVGTICRV